MDESIRIVVVLPWTIDGVGERVDIDVVVQHRELCGGVDSEVSFDVDHNWTLDRGFESADVGSMIVLIHQAVVIAVLRAGLAKRSEDAAAGD